ncbi:MAG: protein kinase family protein [Sphingomonas sp.]|uniref:class III lanthionine synthetase LanKC N-terminal domain-containing protein n=1 Tax=Sphingomonas sp. TaxID=28214 RepID=UPI001ACCC8B4|nr:hypothetical protein [Sphingomonas sp.]MBN8808396.1 protein kinase family protein [Sphingomonas sp.]
MLSDRYTSIVIPPPPGAALITDGKWHFVGVDPVEAQGWKLYISASRPHFVGTLQAVSPIFERHNISYKYVATDKALRKMNAGLYGLSQVGKVIVAYLRADQVSDDLVMQLKGALSPFRYTSPKPPFAIEMGGGYPLSYRFGSFHGTTLNVGNRQIEDDRSRAAQWIRAELQDPFLPFLEAPPDRTAFDQLLAGFPIYEVMSHGGKGGVFAALDMSSETCTERVLKVGYRCGMTLPDGRDGMDLLRTEHQFFRLLHVHNLQHVAPAMHAFHEYEDRNVMILDRVDGTSLFHLKRSGKLTIEHLESALHILAHIHAAKLYVGDPKLANFLASGNGEVLAIDFESAGEMVTAAFDSIRTYHFANPTISDVATRERVHFLYSVLHRELRDSFSESDRVIDLPAFLLSFDSADDIEAWAVEAMKRELFALNPESVGTCLAAAQLS